MTSTNDNVQFTKPLLGVPRRVKVHFHHFKGNVESLIFNET